MQCEGHERLIGCGLRVAGCGCCDMIFNDVRCASPCLCDASVAVQLSRDFFCAPTVLIKGLLKTMREPPLQAVKVSGAARLGTLVPVPKARSTCASSHQALIGLCAFDHRVSPRLAHLEKPVENKARNGQRKPQVQHVRDLYGDTMAVQAATLPIEF